MERYVPADPRVVPDACEHTQILDISVGKGTAWCLDCGFVLDLQAGWSHDPTEPPLNDADLLAKRIHFNNVWLDQLYKMQPSDPDDPEREDQVRKDLEKRGVTRLDVEHAE